MGFLDKVKEKAAEAIEQGKDVAQGQQLKLQLKKLEAEEEEALAAFGNAAFTLYEAGNPLDVVRPRRGRGAHPHRTQRDRGKKAEANAAGADADGATPRTGRSSAVELSSTARGAHRATRPRP